MHKTSSRSLFVLALVFAASLSATAALAGSQDAGPVPERNDAAKTQLSWAELDVDKDGSLSASEAEASPSLKAHFQKADADADGSLTGEEYRQYLGKVDQAKGTAKEPNSRPQG